ncbi:MAG: TonB-dependent receptor [Bacteroidota bacterium]|nr:TonB-dependent receptor [Bacteroidota bacterium]MDP4205042.1 TonB-dependent receptor [Bacteroidota bacterium]
MKKKREFHGLDRLGKKVMRIMKLTFLLSFAWFSVIGANSYSQTTNVNLNVNKQTIVNVFKQIQEQSGYFFYYNNEEVKSLNPVSINIKNAKITDVLDRLLKNSGMNYKVIDRYIVIKRNAAPANVPQKRIKVKGAVTDKQGVGMPGVTVSVKGTTIGAITDIDGKYTIEVPGSTSSLQFSFVGMISQIVAIKGKTEVNVTLEEELHGIDEVVVVGYGQQRRETVTGSVSTIQTKEIKQSPAANLAVTLAGRLPGLTTIQTSGEPGYDATYLYLRGQGTLNGQAPLILVDGVPRELTYIDPNEVETVSILKDASSTAVFGVRGANGVILVTTKRGSVDNQQISMSMERGFQDFTRLPTPVHSWEYATLRNQALANDGRALAFTQEQIDHYRNQDEPEAYPDNNWMKMVSRDFTPQTRYNLNISGGGKKATYFVNAGYLDQGGQWKVDQKDYDPSSFLHRYNFRSNIDLKLNPTLSATLNVGGYLEKANSPGFSALAIMAYTMVTPNTQIGPLTPDGQVVSPAVNDGLNAYAMINRSGYSQNTRSNVTASYGMEQKLDFLTQGLSTKMIVSFDTYSSHSLSASQSHQNWLANVVKGSNGKDSVAYSRKDNSENTPLGLGTSASFKSYFNYQWFVNYTRTFNKLHDVTGMVLLQRDERIENSERLPYRYVGMAGRATYGFDHKYFAEFNAGYNGSEQFAKGHRFGFFPAVSGSWVVSNENFLKDNKTLTFLKLRGSWGEVGNDQLGGTRFLYLDDIKMDGGYSGSIGRGQSINEFYFGNPDLQWEVAKKVNIATEIGLFNDLKLTVDLFHEKRDNVLIDRNLVPSIVGMNSIPPLNVGRVTNKGYELELNFHHTFSKDFSMMSNLNLSHSKNKVLYADEPELPADYAFRYRRTGLSIMNSGWWTRFGYETDGYWKSQEEIDASGLVYPSRKPRPGDFKYKDLNHDGYINDADKVPLKYTDVPEYTFGAAFSFNYKNLDLSLLFQGVAHVSKYYYDQGVWEFTGSNGVYYDNSRYAWTPERAAAGEKISFPALSTAQSSSECQNDFFFQNCAFWRLKNLELGYTLPMSLSKKIKSSKIRLYVNGLNLFTVDHMISKNLDPEVTSNYSYPMTRVFNFGVNVNF